MHIKPVGKIAIIVIIGLVAFFGIKHYQTGHPAAPIVSAVDSTKNVKVGLTSQLDSAAKLSSPINKPIIEHSQIPEKKHESKPKEHKPVEKKKDGERKNLDLNNF